MLIILCLAIIDVILSPNYLDPRVSREKSAERLFCLFFINYIPLTLFEVYHTEISLYWNFIGLENITYLDFLRFLWNSFLTLLQYSSSVYFYGFWASSFISLIIVYDSSQTIKAHWPYFFEMINPLLFLLYSHSAGENEYFIMYGVSVFVFASAWAKFVKINLYDADDIHDIMVKYYFIFIVDTVFFFIKVPFPKLDNFDIFFWFISISLSFGIFYSLAFYFIVSLLAVYDFFIVTWADFKEKYGKGYKIEKSTWKICKIYFLIIFFIYAMHLTYNLVADIWGEIWILKEMMFLISSCTVGNLLMYPEDGDYIDTFQAQSNTFSVYCQIWVVRIIYRIIY